MSASPVQKPAAGAGGGTTSEARTTPPTDPDASTASLLSTTEGSHELHVFARFLSDSSSTEPIRGELFSLAHLQDAARELARASPIRTGKHPGHPLLRQVWRNGKRLVQAHRAITEATRRRETLTPDAEWLLDNFHIVEGVLREVRQDLPRGYYKQLPKLAVGPLADFPRVYALAFELIAHTDSALDETTLVRFVQAYQSVAPLTIGELWAVPIMLRLGFLENLGRLAQQMLDAWAQRRSAETCAQGLRSCVTPNAAGRDWIGTAGEQLARHFPGAAGPGPGPRPPEAAVGSSFQPTNREATHPRIEAFVVRLLQVLREHGPETSPIIEWLESHFAGLGAHPAQLLRREHQRQAANQVSVGNCVTSLRLLSAIDWSTLFEQLSMTDAVLRQDPAATYPQQDFPTRDRYRQAVEKLARGSGWDELSVARRALALALGAGVSDQDSANRGQDPAVRGQGAAQRSQEPKVQGARPDASPQTPESARERHVGYYLVAAGRRQLAKEIGYHPAPRDWLLEKILAHAQIVYFGGLALVYGLLLIGASVWIGRHVLSPSGWPVAIAIILVLLPLSELTVGIVHYLGTLFLPPRVLPKLDFRKGIPREHATFVVMPTMLLRPESAAVLVDRLEVHFLSNPDPQLRFALLTDFADAPTETMPEDQDYLRDAGERIRSLNERYCGRGAARFFLLHRRRRWNPKEGCWMGWERKRGKLCEFNRLLRGARDTSFVAGTADLSQVPLIRHVITLDADTQLPREAAQRLVGTLAHPLNRPRYHPGCGRVVEGYGVLQPRVTLSLLAATRSLFATILSASAGIDPYTTAVSDVYQDLFGNGSYTGKGIYDVDAFQAAVGHTFPDNHILSHDLIEGNYARCGLVTDIELLDDFPARYHAYARREHRWARGDWQLLPWILPAVPLPGGGRRPNPLPALARWKVFDNLRRTLVPPALVVLLIAGWTLPLGPPWFWTAMALVVVCLPLLQVVANELVAAVRLSLRFQPGAWRLQLRDLAMLLRATGGQVLLAIIFLEEQARLLVDAIARTLVRLLLTRRHLLEWETAATTERRLGLDFVSFILNLWPAPLLAMAVGLLVGLVRPDALPQATPLLVAWFVSPAVAYWVSRPFPVAEAPLQPAEQHELRCLARRTWSFFERFLTAQDHWLPPDNFQEDPKGEIAHRTSPTNIGFYLLSSLTAHDLGYLSLPALVERLEKTFDALEQLDRFHGHLYNWYDTQTLQPLQPRYVSTVDSGNLLACLLALKQGLRAKTEEPLWPGGSVDGLRDTLALAREELQSIEPPDAGAPLGIFRSLDALGQQAEKRLNPPPADLPERRTWLAALARDAEEMLQSSHRLAETLRESPAELLRWLERFSAQVQDLVAELDALAPWLGEVSDIAAFLPPGEDGGEAMAVKVLEAPGSLADLAETLDSFSGVVAEDDKAAETGRLDLLKKWSASIAPEVLGRCHRLADRAGSLASEMEFRILYNEQRYLFSIGFNPTLNRLDNAHYDLLASEACLTSFLAIARGQVPKRHWFQLGRMLTRAGTGVALLSWGGTMFEYLMPRLLLQSYRGTLLDESYRSVVARQIEYGRQRGVPWGISESGFNALDKGLDYQYQSFGVPGLGLKRGLGQDLVIAPYATALALAVRPRAALENFRSLRAAGALAGHGFYEAIDYSRDRLGDQGQPALVRSFMAHHQGMTLVALGNCLLGELMVRRFHAEPIVRSTELLLQERVPRSAPVLEPHRDEAAAERVVRDQLVPVSRRVTTAQTPSPRAHLLSNGHYTVMVTNAGSGLSTWGDLAVTRWREDRTCDAWGQFLYIRDLRSGLVWSAGYQPVGRAADDYEVIYSTDKAEFRRFDGGIESHLEIAVSPEHAAEVRRLTLTNHNARAHELEATSYAEIVIQAHAADLAHPAFQKLFVETEYLPGESALLCRRRPRSPDQKPIWAVHVLAVEGPGSENVQYETDRARFLGRGRTTANAVALERGAVLSGTTGPVLDPVVSLRRRVQIPAGGTATLAFTTAVAQSREEALALADQYHSLHSVTRAFELAWAHSQVELRHLHLSTEEAHLFQRLAASIAYAGSALRTVEAVAANRQGQPDLWRQGISGDRPIVLVKLAQPEHLPLVRQLLLAHAYWRFKGLLVDLVILNESPTSYHEDLQHELQNLVRASESHALIDKPGGAFIRKAAMMSEPDRILLEAAARVVLAGDRGGLSSQADRPERPPTLPARLVIAERPRRDEPPATNGAAPPQQELLFSNGFGGFTPDGREYHVLLRSRGDSPASTAGTAPRGVLRALQAGRKIERAAEVDFLLPPAPWINVVANPGFGFLVSESGAGYTWAGNSQANRLTPWSNDPVADPPGEALYLRDEVTGQFWTPTPLPIGKVQEGKGERKPAITVRHGQGYTIFERQSHGLAQELTLFVPAADPIKLVRLRIGNRGKRARHLSATFYAEWVLGTVRDQAAMNVIPALDEETGALLASNPFNADFASAIAFADVNVRPRTFTGDRTEFVGRNGSASQPAALGRVELSGRLEATLDPCAALMAPFELEPGEEREIVFFLGQAGSLEDVRRLVRRYREPGRVEAAFTDMCRRWAEVLETVQVRTPNRALDLLLNRWLLYQVLSCRLWGRSAFYQSGGAYGFRDQLQDVLALVHGAPEQARAHILRAGARQFPEGDVQHWWHPGSGRGIRTRFSDDFLWLPFAVAHYVDVTGDGTILDERLPFLDAPLLRPEQEEDYGLPGVSGQTAPLFEHCTRAIDHGLRMGAHGLPLMGTGDWNDGMNRVGAGGKGESVWNAWFLISILERFRMLAESRGDRDRAARYRDQANHLQKSIEDHAWDGRWYRRAYFDDGTPLGSAQNDECRIDAIVQAWAVIAGAGRSSKESEVKNRESEDKGQESGDKGQESGVRSQQQSLRDLTPDSRLRTPGAERARQAMAAVEELLVRPADQLILLLTPPFDQGTLQPGYIKGYLPGIRENGGQYTHAATWVVQAMALLGQGTEAMRLFDLLNPIQHAADPQGVARYKVEPYVLAGDVYSQPPHVGRGGWTWYTGSAGWLYRIGLETLLGFSRRGNRLRLAPRIPSAWDRYEIIYRYGSSFCHITVDNPDHVEQGVKQVIVDGRTQAEDTIELVDDGSRHEVEVRLGK
jgi:cyclic beta-1,2-glucan synthetase